MLHKLYVVRICSFVQHDTYHLQQINYLQTTLPQYMYHPQLPIDYTVFVFIKHLHVSQTMLLHPTLPFKQRHVLQSTANCSPLGTSVPSTSVQSV